jgi:alpha-D-ribose 1-methylphosphonate 5-triphosphate synthase subunit PhnH
MNIAESMPADFLSAEASSLDFRQIMKAMSYPGRVCHCLSMIDETDVPSVNRSAQQIANVLVSREVNVSYFVQEPTEACEQWIRFQLRSQIVPINDADYLFTHAENLAELKLENLPMGTSESPEKSITLIVSVSSDFNKPSQRPLQFTGPGINPDAPATQVNLDSVSTRFFEQRAALAPLFPLGIDVFFCSEREFIALPRTTQVTW